MLSGLESLVSLTLVNLKRCLFCLVLFPIITLASTEAEINYLLKYVEDTDCQYERNGDFHDGLAAAKHIRKKYRYFEDEIGTTEDFIRLSATQSSMTRKKYRIHCEDQPIIDSAQWLGQELRRYRSINSAVKKD